MLDLGWSGRAIEISIGDKDADYSTFAQVFRGAADGIEATDTELTIRVCDRQELLACQCKTVFSWEPGDGKGRRISRARRAR
jgi:hypothetical protein